MAEKVYLKKELAEIRTNFIKALEQYYSGKKVSVGQWKFYPHEYGVFIEGMIKKQWAYLPERKPFKYDWAFWKIQNKIANYNTKEGLKK